METMPLWASRHGVRRINKRDRALSIAMCRALRSDWDLDATTDRILSLGADQSTVEEALAIARRLRRRDPTIAAARAEQALAAATDALRALPESARPCRT